MRSSPCTGKYYYIVFFSDFQARKRRFSLLPGYFPSSRL